MSRIVAVLVAVIACTLSGCKAIQVTNLSVSSTVQFAPTYNAAPHH